jgi:glutaconate CoA-transferase subunit A
MAPPGPSPSKPEVSTVPERKLMSEAEVIDRFVADGDTVYVGYTSAAYGLCRAVARAGRKGLEIVGGSVGAQGTILIMAGCVSRVRTGYIGAALRPGVVQDMMTSGELKFEDYSNQAIALMLMAGALGIPFIPTRSFLGSDYLDPAVRDYAGQYLGDQKWRLMESPFDDRQQFVALPALRPQVALLHAQRADEFGNIQAWGHLGDARWAYWAAERVIVSVEEIVPPEVIRADPSRTIAPGFRVAAVVHMPYGAHPSGQAGYYDFDYSFQARSGMSRIARSHADWAEWSAEWIYGVDDNAGYIDQYRRRFGQQSLDAIRATAGRRPTADVFYGYAPALRFRADA